MDVYLPGVTSGGGGWRHAGRGFAMALLVWGYVFLKAALLFMKSDFHSIGRLEMGSSEVCGGVE